MRPAGHSLGTVVAGMTIAVAAMGLVGLGSLVTTTSTLNFISRDLSTAIESVQVTDEIEVQLLLHNESASPVSRGVTRAALRRAVNESGRFVQSPEERRRVAAVRRTVDAYLQPGAGDQELAAALVAARRLSSINVKQARGAQERAELWNGRANVGGISAAIVLVAGVAVFLVWLRRGPFRLIAGLSRAMERFSSGALGSRAPEAGPRELVTMARSFNATARALVRARQRQTQYVTTAIHDLRTPLSAIQLAVGYITPDQPLPPEPRIRELAELIGRQLTRLNGLVGDVLNATRIEAGDLTLLRERFDMRAVITASVGLFRELAPEHVIELAPAPGAIELDADRARIEQVVNNLLSNAVKYSPPGSRVRVGLNRAGDELTLTVSDEGEGIAPEDRALIFETFQRHTATHAEAPGTGLGLWVSKHVVEAHGGRIELDSELGEGSTFRVVLPVDITTPDGGAAQPGAPAARG